MEIWLIIISLLFSAFFSSMETSFVSADIIRLSVKSNEPTRTARLLRFFYARQPQFLAATLIGNTVALVFYGQFMAKILDEPLKQMLLTHLALSPEGAVIDVLVLLSQTAIATLLVLFVAEFTPKTLALIKSNRILEICVYPMYVIFYAIWIFSWLVMKSSELLITKVFGINLPEKQKGVGIADINNYIQKVSDSSDENPEIDPDIFENALKFKETQVRDCMIPRTDIVAVEANETIDALQETFETSGHTKIIIFQENLDNVLGYCHALQLFERPENIQHITKTILSVPETTPVSQMMSEFLKTHSSIAIVMDEFGGTGGIVTVEDIVEEVLGEIEDEHDDPTDRPQFEKLAENVYQISAKYKIDDLLEEHNLQLPTGDYESLGGYILSVHGTVPEQGTTVLDGNISILIQEMEGVKIETVQITLEETEE